MVDRLLYLAKKWEDFAENEDMVTCAEELRDFVGKTNIRDMIEVLEAFQEKMDNDLLGEAITLLRQAWPTDT